MGIDQTNSYRVSLLITFGSVVIIVIKKISELTEIWTSFVATSFSSCYSVQFLGQELNWQAYREKLAEDSFIYGAALQAQENENSLIFSCNPLHSTGVIGRPILLDYRLFYSVPTPPPYRTRPSFRGWSFFCLNGLSWCRHSALALILSLWNLVPHARGYKSVALDLSKG